LPVEEIRDVAPGLWLWRLSYPDWHEEAGWPEVVSSTCVESGGEVAVLDALAPPEGSPVWERLDARPPRSRSSSSPTTCATSTSS